MNEVTYSGVTIPANISGAADRPSVRLYGLPLWTASVAVEVACKKQCKLWNCKVHGRNNKGNCNVLLFND